MKIQDLKEAETLYILTAPDSSEEILRACGERIFVRGEETQDVERIGAAFRDWAQSWARRHPPSEYICLSSERSLAARQSGGGR